MASHAFSVVLDPVDPAVRAGAKDLARRLGVDSPVEAAVRAMLDEVTRGARIVVLRTEDEVTPAQAAQMLGVTRQFVDRLCATGVLTFRRLPGSSHRRIRVKEVLDVVTERERRRAGGDAVRSAMDELGA